MTTAKSAVEWRVSPKPVPYPDAVATMEERVAAIAAGQAAEMVWLLEHPPLYTSGTSSCDEELLDPDRFPVYHSGRGGRYTYHGPGQRVAYVMLNVRARGADVRRFVRDLEVWVLHVLSSFGVAGVRRGGRVGIWVMQEDGREEKIAAIGIRLRHWISFHGFALNVAPDLEHFSGIVPCGLTTHGVTSLAALGRSVTLAQVDRALQGSFTEIFPDPPVSPPVRRDKAVSPHSTLYPHPMGGKGCN